MNNHRKTSQRVEKVLRKKKKKKDGRNGDTIQATFADADENHTMDHENHILRYRKGAAPPPQQQTLSIDPTTPVRGAATAPSQAATTTPVTPFSPLFRNPSLREAALVDVSLAQCRRVSVMVVVQENSTGNENSTEERCLFPAPGAPRDVLVVNPSALPEQPTNTIMETAQWVGASTEDWVRSYRFHQVVWAGGGSRNNNNSTTSTNALTTLVQAVSNDLVTTANGTTSRIPASSTSDGKEAAVQRLLIGLSHQDGTSSSRTTTMTTGETLFGRVAAARKPTSVAQAMAVPRTMTDPGDILRQYGVLGLIVYSILDQHKNTRSQTAAPICTISMLEVVGDTDHHVYDLLVAKPYHSSRTVVHLSHGGRVVIGLSHVRLDSLRHLGQVLRRAYTAALHPHRKSARGHMVATLTVVPDPSRPTDTRVCRCVDLATPSTANAAQTNNNNTSLTALGHILRSALLRQAGTYQPMAFRDSVLTQVLQASFTAPDSRVVVVSHVHAHPHHYAATMLTLRFLHQLVARPGPPVVQSPFGKGAANAEQQQYTIPPDDPRWLQELLSDPRQRLAKAVGRSPPRGVPRVAETSYPTTTTTEYANPLLDDDDDPTPRASNRVQQQWNNEAMAPVVEETTAGEAVAVAEPVAEDHFLHRTDTMEDPWDVGVDVSVEVYKEGVAASDWMEEEEALLYRNDTMEDGSLENEANDQQQHQQQPFFREDVVDDSEQDEGCDDNDYLVDHVDLGQSPVSEFWPRDGASPLPTSPALMALEEGGYSSLAGEPIDSEKGTSNGQRTVSFADERGHGPLGADDYLDLSGTSGSLLVSEHNNRLRSKQPAGEAEVDRHSFEEEDEAAEAAIREVAQDPSGGRFSYEYVDTNIVMDPGRAVVSESLYRDMEEAAVNPHHAPNQSLPLSGRPSALPVNHAHGETRSASSRTTDQPSNDLYRHDDETQTTRVHTSLKPEREAVEHMMGATEVENTRTKKRSLFSSLWNGTTEAHAPVSNANHSTQRHVEVDSLNPSQLGDDPGQSSISQVPADDSLGLASQRPPPGPDAAITQDQDGDVRRARMSTNEQQNSDSRNGGALGRYASDRHSEGTQPRHDDLVKPWYHHSQEDPPQSRFDTMSRNPQANEVPSLPLEEPTFQAKEPSETYVREDPPIPQVPRPHEKHFFPITETEHALHAFDNERRLGGAALSRDREWRSGRSPSPIEELQNNPYNGGKNANEKNFFPNTDRNAHVHAPDPMGRLREASSSQPERRSGVSKVIDTPSIPVLVPSQQHGPPIRGEEGFQQRSNDSRDSQRVAPSRPRDVDGSFLPGLDGSSSGAAREQGVHDGASHAQPEDNGLRTSETDQPNVDSRYKTTSWQPSVEQDCPLETANADSTYKTRPIDLADFCDHEEGLLSRESRDINVVVTDRPDRLEKRSRNGNDGLSVAIDELSSQQNDELSKAASNMHGRDAGWSELRETLLNVVDPNTDEAQERLGRETLGEGLPLISSDIAQSIESISRSVVDETTREEQERGNPAEFETYPQSSVLSSFRKGQAHHDDSSFGEIGVGGRSAWLHKGTTGLARSSSDFLNQPETEQQSMGERTARRELSHIEKANHHLDDARTPQMDADARSWIDFQRSTGETYESVRRNSSQDVDDTRLLVFPTEEAPPPPVQTVAGTNSKLMAVNNDFDNDAAARPGDEITRAQQNEKTSFPNCESVPDNQESPSRLLTNTVPPAKEDSTFAAHHPSDHPDSDPVGRGQKPTRVASTVLEASRPQRGYLSTHLVQDSPQENEPSHLLSRCSQISNVTEGVLATDGDDSNNGNRVRPSLSPSRVPSSTCSSPALASRTDFDDFLDQFDSDDISRTNILDRGVDSCQDEANDQLQNMRGSLSSPKDETSAARTVFAVNYPGLQETKSQENVVFAEQYPEEASDLLLGKAQLSPKERQASSGTYSDTNEAAIEESEDVRGGSSAWPCDPLHQSLNSDEGLPSFQKEGSHEQDRQLLLETNYDEKEGSAIEEADDCRLGSSNIVVDPPPLDAEALYSDERLHSFQDEVLDEQDISALSSRGSHGDDLQIHAQGALENILQESEASEELTAEHKSLESLLREADSGESALESCGKDDSLGNTGDYFSRLLIGSEYTPPSDTSRDDQQTPISRDTSPRQAEPVISIDSQLATDGFSMEAMGHSASAPTAFKWGNLASNKTMGARGQGCYKIGRIASQSDDEGLQHQNGSSSQVLSKEVPPNLQSNSGETIECSNLTPDPTKFMHPYDSPRPTEQTVESDTAYEFPSDSPVHPIERRTRPDDQESLVEKVAGENGRYSSDELDSLLNVSILSSQPPPALETLPLQGLVSDGLDRVSRASDRESKQGGIDDGGENGDVLHPNDLASAHPTIEESAGRIEARPLERRQLQSSIMSSAPSEGGEERESIRFHGRPVQYNQTEPRAGVPYVPQINRVIRSTDEPHEREALRQCPTTSVQPLRAAGTAESQPLTTAVDRSRAVASKPISTLGHQLPNGHKTSSAESERPTSTTTADALMRLKSFETETQHRRPTDSTFEPSTTYDSPSRSIRSNAHNSVATEGSSALHEIDELEAAVDKVRQTNITVWEESLSSIENLRQLQASQLEELARTRSERNQANEELDRLRAQLKSQAQEHEMAMKKCDYDKQCLEQEISDGKAVKEEVVKIAEDAIGMQAALEKKVDDLEHEAQRLLDTRVPKLEYESLEATVMGLKQHIEQLKKEVARLLLELQGRSSALEEANASLSLQGIELRDLRDENRAARAQVTSLRRELEELKGIREELKAAKDSLRRFQGESESLVQRERELHANLQQELDEAKHEATQVPLLETDLARLRSELSEYRDSLADSNETVARLGVEKAQLAQRLDSTTDELDRRVSDVHELTVCTKRLLEEREGDRSKMSGMETALSSFQLETRSRVEKVVQHRNEAATLLENALKENKALDEVNRKLSESHQHLQKEHAAAIDRLRAATRKAIHASTNRDHQRHDQDRRFLRTRRNDDLAPPPPQRPVNTTPQRPAAEVHGDADSNSQGEPSQLRSHWGSQQLNQTRDTMYSSSTRGGGGRIVNTTEVLSPTEELAAKLALATRSRMGTHTTGIGFADFDEKLYKLEDEKDQEVLALKERIKALERRTTRYNSTH